MEEMEDKKSNMLDYGIAILLGIATILGALSAYYSELWGGNMQSKYNSAISTLNEANTLYLESLSDYNKADFDDFQDDYFYVQWKEAYEKGDEDTAYFKERMTPEYGDLLYAEDYDVAYEAYAAAYDEKMSYFDANMDSSFVMMDSSKAMVGEGDKANEWGDTFTLATVFFTIVLFFGGMAAMTEKYKLKMVYVVFSLIMFAYSLYTMFSVPFPG